MEKEDEGFNWGLLHRYSGGLLSFEVPCHPKNQRDLSRFILKCTSQAAEGSAEVAGRLNRQRGGQQGDGLRS